MAYIGEPTWHAVTPSKFLCLACIVHWHCKISGRCKICSDQEAEMFQTHSCLIDNDGVMEGKRLNRDYGVKLFLHIGYHKRIWWFHTEFSIRAWAPIRVYCTIGFLAFSDAFAQILIPAQHTHTSSLTTYKYGKQDLRLTGRGWSNTSKARLRPVSSSQTSKNSLKWSFYTQNKTVWSFRRGETFKTMKPWSKLYRLQTSTANRSSNILGGNLDLRRMISGASSWVHSCASVVGLWNLQWKRILE